MGNRSARATESPVWSSPMSAVALAVIVAQALWRGALLERGYYGQDDFLVLSGTASRNLAEVFEADHSGGFSPGAQLLARLQVSLAPMEWAFSAGITLVLQGVASGLMWVLLTKLLGRHWARLPVLVAFCFGPLTLWSTQWWSASLVFWPTTILLLAAGCAVLQAPLRFGGRLRLAAVVCVAVALLFTERAVLQPVILVGLSLLAHHREVGSHGPWLRRAWRHERWAWLGFVVVVAAYGWVRASLVPLDASAGSDLGQVITTYVRHVAGGLLGGPWAGDLPSHAYLVPKSWAVGAGAVLLLALVAVTLQRGGIAARIAWATFALHALMGLGLLALVGQRDLTASLGLVHRFGADLSVAAAVCAAGALSRVELPAMRWGAREVPAPRMGKVAAAVTAVLLVCSAAVTTSLLAPNLYHDGAREYVQRARADLREEPQAVLLDSGVPDEVMSGWFGPAATVTTVLSAAPERPVFGIPSQHLRMVLPSGRLTPVILSGAVQVEPSSNEACGYPVRTEGRRLSMEQSVPMGRWVLRLGYYTNADTFGTIVVAGAAIRFPVRQGLNAIDVPVTGGFEHFEISIEAPDTTLCLATATVGVPEAVADGAALQ